MVQPLCKIVGQFLIKLHVQKPFSPEIPLLGISLKRMKQVHTNTCTQMLIVHNWKQPNTLQLLKDKYKLLIQATRWMKLKYIMLS